MKNALRRVSRSSDSGAEIIEYAVLVPLLVFVMFAIADIGLVFQAYQTVSNAAREGARVGVLACEPVSSTCYGATDIQNRVAAFITAGMPGNAATPVTVAQCVSVNPGAGGPNFVAERVTVTYTYTFKFMGRFAPRFGGSFGSLPIVAVSTMRREKQTACS